MVLYNLPSRLMIQPNINCSVICHWWHDSYPSILYFVIDATHSSNLIFVIEAWLIPLASSLSLRLIALTCFPILYSLSLSLRHDSSIKPLSLRHDIPLACPLTLRHDSSFYSLHCHWSNGSVRSMAFRRMTHHSSLFFIIDVTHSSSVYFSLRHDSPLQSVHYHWSMIHHSSLFFVIEAWFILVVCSLWL